jgi:hypothetical protein
MLRFFCLRFYPAQHETMIYTFLGSSEVFELRRIVEYDTPCLIKRDSINNKLPKAMEAYEVTIEKDSRT